MRDADSGRLIWQSNEWDDAFTRETASQPHRRHSTITLLCPLSGHVACDMVRHHCSSFTHTMYAGLLCCGRDVLVLPVHVPSSLLSLQTISREMVFHSRHSMSAFRLTQSILFHSHLIEHWAFTFGFVIPDSSNSWQCVIAKGAGGVTQPQLTAQQLSGNVVIETRFWDSEQLLGVSRIRVYYDGPE